MSNGSEACCALGICCPPASAEQIAGLAKILTDNAARGKFTAESAATVILEHFDLAPKGMLQPLLVEAVRMSKHAHT